MDGLPGQKGEPGLAAAIGRKGDAGLPGQPGRQGDNGRDGKKTLIYRLVLILGKLIYHLNIVLHMSILSK